MGRRLTGWFLVAVVGAAAAASMPRAFVEDAAAGDPKVADTLFKSGKQAMTKGDAAGAISYFTKALEENADLIEACWWRASAQEKAGDKAAALASYREYLSLFDGKPVASKEEQRLKALAEKNISALAAGEKEFRKLEDTYVAALLTFAKDSFVRDPGISLKAVQAILAVRPDHEEALKLNEKLGGDSATGSAGGPGPPTGPFKDVKTWTDLIADKTFKANGVEFPESLMVVDEAGGTAITPAGFIDTGNSYAFENEFRFTTFHDPKWVAGLGFGFKNSKMVAAIVLPGRVVLTRYLPNGQHEDLAEYTITPMTANVWHRLGLIVKGPAVEVWFDGKKAMTWREPSGADFGGEMVVVQEKCRTEWRLFHVGKVD